MLLICHYERSRTSQDRSFAVFFFQNFAGPEPDRPWTWQDQGLQSGPNRSWSGPVSVFFGPMRLEIEPLPGIHMDSMELPPGFRGICTECVEEGKELVQLRL